MENLKLYEIAKFWSVVSNEDVKRFKKSFAKAFPDAPKAIFGIRRDEDEGEGFEIIYATVVSEYRYKINHLNTFIRFE